MAALLIKLTENLLIGNSDDGYSFSKSGPNGVGGVLNVAQDLRGKCGWPGVEYMQVGLVDGPGNDTTTYCAAIMSLVALVRRHSAVAVYDHDGGRALAVSLMYLNLVGGKYRPNPLAWSRWLTWEERLSEVKTKMLVTKPLPQPHSTHIAAFAKIPFGVMEALL